MTREVWLRRMQRCSLSCFVSPPRPTFLGGPYGSASRCPAQSATRGKYSFSESVPPMHRRRGGLLEESLGMQVCLYSDHPRARRSAVRLVILLASLSACDPDSGPDARGDAPDTEAAGPST